MHRLILKADDIQIILQVACKHEQLYLLKYTAYMCVLRESGRLHLTDGQLQSAESEHPTAHYIPNLCVVCRDG